jgi:predicted metal-dependent HD superfamily phosphohydrolase
MNTSEPRVALAQAFAAAADATGLAADKRRGHVLDGLLAAYAAPSRHYHGLAHIADLLDTFAHHRGAARDPAAVTLAILWHDAVYDATRSDNEAASAASARADLGGLGAAAPLLARVEALILATRHAAAIDPSDGDMALLVDLDLSILGAAADV